MSKPWKGAAQRATAQDFVVAAEELGCDVAALQAVWQVEASGKPFRSDGTLERRFEPHKLRKPEGNYKTSAKLSFAAREAKFDAAYARNQEDAMRATSWGGPQIMGFNAQAAGYASAGDMVKAMAASEGEQLRAFVRLIKSWRLDSALRAHDWRTFAARYNGNANVAEYSARIESAFQKFSGKASPAVLRSGDKGAAVKRLQYALGIDVDGKFGPATDKAVREFQQRHGLPVDGIVGRRTWEALEGYSGVRPVKQAAAQDRIAKASEMVALASTAAGSVATVGGALPESSLNLLIIAAAVIGIGALALHAFRKLRDVA
ncbi:N-acetylmuramidase domain-containing protein [Paracoccus sp. APAP_BH8]|uniref:N-acetylmuramidase domain-containing protein n=1 Tax=Paracoccus sp. APAP_BH8 TaxID=3110237 RepID=UPI002FD83981